MKLILCCDYGLDDAAATVDALAHAEEDGYSEVVLVAVGGNVPAEVSLRNAKKLLAALPFSYPSATVVDTTAEAQPSDYLNLSESDIIEALTYATTDGFWKSNIRSAKKFREKFETLIIQSRSRQGKNFRNGFNQFPQNDYDIQALERELVENGGDPG